MARQCMVFGRKVALVRKLTACRPVEHRVESCGRCVARTRSSQVRAAMAASRAFLHVASFRLRASAAVEVVSGPS